MAAIFCYSYVHIKLIDKLHIQIRILISQLKYGVQYFRLIMFNLAMRKVIMQWHDYFTCQ